MTTTQRDRAAELLMNLSGDDQAQHPLRSLWAVEAVDLLRQAEAPAALLRDVHPNVHEPERLAPVVAELLRWLREGVR